MEDEAAKLGALFRNPDNPVDTRVWALREVCSEFNLDTLLPLLLEALGDPDAQIRVEAARALNWKQDERVFAPLTRLLADPDGRVVAAALEALIEIGDPRAMPPLFQLLEGGRVDSISPRYLLSRMLEFLARHASDSMDRLLSLLTHEEPERRGAAVFTLGCTGDARVVPAILAVLEHDTDVAVRSAAIQALGDLGDPRAVAPLVNILLDSEADEILHLRADAALAFGLGAFALPPLLEHAHDPDPQKRHRVLSVGIHDPRSQDALYGATGEADAELADFAALRLGFLGDQRALPRLALIALADGHPMQATAVNALVRLGEAALDNLRLALRSASPHARQNAISGLAAVAGPCAVDDLLPLVDDPDSTTARLARYTLSQLGHPIL